MASATCPPILPIPIPAPIVARPAPTPAPSIAHAPAYSRENDAAACMRAYRCIVELHVRWFTYTRSAPDADHPIHMDAARPRGPGPNEHPRSLDRVLIAQSGALSTKLRWLVAGGWSLVTSYQRPATASMPSLPDQSNEHTAQDREDVGLKERHENLEQTCAHSHGDGRERDV